MSQKITGKNLSYAQKEPPFLAALRGQIGDRTGPDPILTARRRPVKPRSASEEAEDAPLVVDEHGDVVADVAVGKDGGVTATVPTSSSREPASPPPAAGDSPSADFVASIGGGGKKRKAGRVIGGGEEDKEEKEDEVAGKRDDHGHDGRRKRQDERTGQGEAKDPKHKGTKHTRGTREAKKSKKIKLSFEDDEEEQ